MTENCKFRKAILSAFYNISQRNFGILLIDLLAQLRLSRTEFTTDMCQETAEEAISQFLLKMYMAVHV